jgi:hypothetical protein
MAYDEGLAQRIRELLEERDALIEKKMFGGVAWLIRGNLACGVIGEQLIVRVGPDEYPRSIGQPHARPFDFTGRPMKGMLVVVAEGYERDADLAAWVEKGTSFALSLPPK